jgi:hypothetical protein
MRYDPKTKTMDYTNKELEHVFSSFPKGKSKALHAKMGEKKEGGREIGKVIAERRAYEKRNPHSYSFPTHQVKSLEKKYPKATEAHAKAKGPIGKYFK